MTVIDLFPSITRLTLFCPLHSHKIRKEEHPSIQVEPSLLLVDRIFGYVSLTSKRAKCWNVTRVTMGPFGVYASLLMARHMQPDRRMGLFDFGRRIFNQEGLDAAWSMLPAGDMCSGGEGGGQSVARNLDVCSFLLYGHTILLDICYRSVILLVHTHESYSGAPLSPPRLCSLILISPCTAAGTSMPYPESSSHKQSPTPESI
jgi:hypothetical protein